MFQMYLQYHLLIFTYFFVASVLTLRSKTQQSWQSFLWSTENTTYYILKMVWEQLKLIYNWKVFLCVYLNSANKSEGTRVVEFLVVLHGLQPQDVRKKYCKNNLILIMRLTLQWRKVNSYFTKWDFYSEWNSRSTLHIQSYLGFLVNVAEKSTLYMASKVLILRVTCRERIFEHQQQVVSNYPLMKAPWISSCDYYKSI